MNRLEWLETQSCAAASSGSAIPERGVSEHWTNVAVAGGLEATDSIRIESRVAESIVVRSRRACGGNVK
jgi:hypothetical protein